MAPAIETIRAPTRAGIERILDRGEPVLISGLTSHWPALERWSDLEYLRCLAGDKRVLVEHFSDGDWHRYDDTTWREIAFSQYLDHLVSPPANGEKYYLQTSLPTEFPELLVDLPRPDCLQPRGNVRLYYGRDTYRSAHYHPVGQALFCQVVGRKTIGLYPPGDTPLLYPQPWYKTRFQFSRVDRFDPPDLARFPRVDRARAVEVTLAPGDALYVPIHWWHWVRGEHIAGHVVYCWRERDLRRWRFPTPGLRSVLGLGMRRARSLAGRVAQRWGASSGPGNGSAD